MAHDKIQALTDFTTTRMTLQNQLGPLKQESRLGRVLLGSKLLKPTVKLLRNTQIHRHGFTVPKRYLKDRDGMPSGIRAFRSIKPRANGWAMWINGIDAEETCDNSPDTAAARMDP